MTVYAYAIGYREATRRATSIAFERRMVDLAEERVDEMTRRGWLEGAAAARGLLDGARASLASVERRELWTAWEWADA